MLKEGTEEITSESQVGFQRGRSTIENSITQHVMLFALRLLEEKDTEHSRYLYLCYEDYQKAFDRVWRAGLWHVMKHLRYPNKLIRLWQILYEETFSTVGVSKDYTEWFKMVVGVLRGCVLSPLVF